MQTAADALLEILDGERPNGSSVLTGFLSGPDRTVLVFSWNGGRPMPFEPIAIHGRRMPARWAVRLLGVVLDRARRRHG